MQRVRTEVGPDAVVVKAERVRSGGVGGFFAKEHFEVTVEVPDPRLGRRPHPPTQPGTAGLSALLDAADAGDAADAAGTGAAERPTPRVSTDGDTFARLLASIDDMADVHPARTRDADDDDVEAGPPRPPAARFAPRGAAVTTAAFGPLTAESEPDLARETENKAAPTPANPRVQPVAFPRIAARPSAQPPATDAAASSPASPAPLGGSSRRALADLGVPASLLGTGPLDEPLPLSALLGALPRPPAAPRTPGTVVAVVAEGDDALPVATALAQRARLDPRDVVPAGDMAPVPGHGRRLLNPTAAARHRAQASAAETVSMVAVGVGPRAEDRAAAAALLAALAPDQIWAVVDARRKTTDLRAWLHDIAGPHPVDVVAASWVHETREPGTVLDLGLPVGWLDGLPATPVVWAAVLSERLDAGARWD